MSLSVISVLIMWTAARLPEIGSSSDIHPQKFHFAIAAKRWVSVLYWASNLDIGFHGQPCNEHVSLSNEARSCRALWISMIACAPGPTPSPLDILHGARGTWTAMSYLVGKTPTRRPSMSTAVYIVFLDGFNFWFMAAFRRFKLSFLF